MSRMPAFARHVHHLDWLRRTLAGAMTIALVISAMGAAMVVSPHTAAASSAVTTDYLNLRSDPNTNAGVIDVMPPGASVEITGDASDGFYPVTYNGEDGWAFGAYIDTSGGGYNTVTATTALNLRSDPSFSAQILDVIPGGGTATLIGDGANGFISVSYNGTFGWVDMDYLSWGGSSTPPTDTSASSQPSADTSSASQASADTGDTSTEATTTSADTGTTPPADAANEDIVSIIYAAADRYGQSRADMLRVAECESNLVPDAVNPSSGASGLFQFMPSTWASTPYANDSIFNAWASANAAGWMWSVGRRDEWECQ